MARSKLLVGIAFVGAVIACDKDSNMLPKLPLVPSPPRPGFVFGYVLEPEAIPVGSVQVTITDGPFKGQSAVSGDTGLYEIRDVDGEFSLTFQKAGYASTTLHVNVGIVQQMNAEIVPLMPPADVSGNWRARFKPSPKCGQVVGAEAIAAIDFVEYGASVAQHGRRLEITLSGGGLVTPAHFGGLIQGTLVSLTIPPPCDYYCTGSTPPPPILSKLPDGHYLIIRQRSGHTGPEFIRRHARAAFSRSRPARRHHGIGSGACQDPEHQGDVLALVDHVATPGADSPFVPTGFRLVPDQNIRGRRLVQAQHVDT